MSDYTPDTEAVCAAYRAGAEPVFTGDGRRTDYRTQHMMGFEFDRWLTGVKAEAWDEGYRASFRIPAPGESPNPYRSAP